MSIDSENIKPPLRIERNKLSCPFCNKKNKGKQMLTLGNNN